MNLNQLVEALDAQVVKGDIISAFEQFAADHCVTLSSPEDKTTNKEQKIEALRWFFNNVAKVNHIERPAFAVVNDKVTDSQFTFNFTDNWGNPMAYNEVIRRTWDNGKIVEEVYLMGQTLNGAAEKATTKKTAAKPVAEPKTVETKPTAKKSAGPVADKKPATKSAKATTETVAKTDDLTIIEGVGPKIAELLIAAGIKSFKELAAAKPAALKAILEAAGKRYQMHDPGSWPKQAALARDGKTAELAQLQAALKGGK